MNDARPLLLMEARGLGRREPNAENWLLRDICIAIHASDRLAIVGPTGSGKTLLLRALARLDGIDTGEVLWRGEPIRGDAVPQFRQQAIYLHQRPALIEGTVEDNLRLPFSFRAHHPRGFRGEEVRALLAQVNRDETFLNRSSRDLSGGEAQIVALLRAIQLQPMVLLLDEPTAALDVESTQLLETLVTNWFDDSPEERALVWVSHDEQQVGRVSDRVVNMRGGQVADGDAETSEQSP
jgi:putative ABC transport system ATP-binding protein